MDIERLREILLDCTWHGDPGCTTGKPGLVELNLVVINVVVNVDIAQRYHRELVDILTDWPASTPGRPVPQLENGQNYIQIGAILDDQQAALHLIALGQVLRLWRAEIPLNSRSATESDRSIAASGCVYIMDVNLGAPQRG